MEKQRDAVNSGSLVEPEPVRLQDRRGIITKRDSDEMHSHDVLSVSPDASPEDLSAFLQPPPFRTFDSFLELIWNSLNAELAAEGWPPPDRKVRVTSTGWCALTGKGVSLPADERSESPGPLHISLGFEYIERRSTPFSRPWFLARLSFAMMKVNRAVGDAKLRAVFDFARLLEASEHRVHYEKIRKAVKNTRDASVGGHLRAIETRPRTIDILTEMRRLIDDGHSAARAAELCAVRKIGTSKVANVRLWNRWK